jgi:regulator of RNase E activity RraA
VCDILDSLGYRDQAMHQRLHPLDPANCTIVGRARTLRWMETDYVVQSDPYLEIEALDSLKQAEWTMSKLPDTAPAYVQNEGSTRL